MIINVNTKETLNTYVTANIKVISSIIQKRRRKYENAPCVTQWTIGGEISLHGLKVGLGFYATSGLSNIKVPTGLSSCYRNDRPDKAEQSKSKNLQYDQSHTCTYNDVK